MPQRFREGQPRTITLAKKSPPPTSLYPPPLFPPPIHPPPSIHPPTPRLYSPPLYSPPLSLDALGSSPSESSHCACGQTHQAGWHIAAHIGIHIGTSQSSLHFLQT
mmetsp:Transcript_131459/g.228498  ORF Transcript_131459/g.228498 Transcript_131459/m.228498 type:complete len:106 (+) Transcript_131459:1390-1707(+)